MRVSVDHQGSLESIPAALTVRGILSSWLTLLAKSLRVFSSCRNRVISHDDDLASSPSGKALYSWSVLDLGAGRDDDLIMFNWNHHGPEGRIAQEVIQWLGDIRVV